MHRIHHSVLVPYTCAQMFALVRDVPRYPEFLPWCPSSSESPGPGPGQVEARVDIAYLGVRSHFKTRNTNQPDSSIDLVLVDGPFRSLQGRWQFQPLGTGGCKVTLDLEYGFAAGLLARAVAPVFDRVANSLIDAFAARARQLHGEPGG